MASQSQPPDDSPNNAEAGKNPVADVLYALVRRVLSEETLPSDLLKVLESLAGSSSLATPAPLASSQPPEKSAPAENSSPAGNTDLPNAAWGESPAEDAAIDLDRAARCGFPEVVFGQGKSVESLRRIFRTLLAANMPVLATRVSPDKGAILSAEFPGSRYNSLGSVFRIDLPGGAGPDAKTAWRGRAAVVTAGTSDMPVAEEARETLDWMGVETLAISDVGVAGPQRLPRHLPQLRTCDAVVVAAGMEGALPSVVGGHLACPVIAVPTSVGYGASLGGFAALLGMLNSCTANVAVVNIDAGFKAGFLAGLIATRAHASRQASASP